MKTGFTIVELLVVIVVIGILASISIVSYIGISNKAVSASLQNDLTSSVGQLKMYQIENESFPTAVTNDGSGNYCPTPTDAKYCIKASPGNTYSYAPGVGSKPQSFYLTDTNTNSTSYSITENSSPAFVIPIPTVTIRNQVWMQYNLDVGSEITGATAQTNNSIVEKWCYNDDPANCSTYGGLYSWDETMNYSTEEGGQGICPTNFHVPSDNEFKILEVNLGMSQAQADANGWRGTDQGTQIKLGGSSNFNALYAGRNGGSYSNIGWYTSYWTSTQTVPGDLYSYIRMVNSSTESRISRNNSINDSNGNKGIGWSVRCLKN